METTESLVTAIPNEGCFFLTILRLSIFKALIDDERSRVYRDRSEAELRETERMTKIFEGLPVTVIVMIDGKKLEILHPSDSLEQNRDYNGWHDTVYRNLILMWVPRRKITDADVKSPENFHDSKDTIWCHIYDHIMALPDGYVVVCDSVFATSRKLDGKLLKLKCQERDDIRVRSEEARALTHIRQYSEWGNNDLTGDFRRLKTQLPVDDLKRAMIQWSCILLHNERTYTCEPNQIKTYFNNLNEQ
mmetsp:Transcript_29729/g.28588  ORF Transcript_29729/g.28588 Transcript_29729/m.28588 type:complete len:247 (-) Transcript_29729:15-755(-)